ncbi:MAG: DNA-3-methyladenine glycosylase, partial [Verrucomicrobiota bacterium]
MKSPLTASFFERTPVTCARELVGCEFHWGRTSGIIVETEAYSEKNDEACHTFSRPSAREFIDLHAAGTAYVYLNYGIHWLTNVVVKHPEERGFVLLRALAPLHGKEIMQRRRNKTATKDLCSGPGKLSQALGIDGSAHGTPLVNKTSQGFAHSSLPVDSLREGPRIGISKAQDLPWRFGIADSEHLSQ